MNAENGHKSKHHQEPLLENTRSTIVPSLYDVIECYEAYACIRKRAKVKPLNGGIKKSLKHFIKIALLSNRYGEGHAIFLDATIREYGRLNEGKFPSPSTLHKDGIYELATLANAKPDKATLELKRAIHEVKRERDRDINYDHTFSQSKRRLKRGDLSNADFDLPYVKMRLCQVGQSTEPWFDKIEEGYNRKQRQDFENDLSFIEDFDVPNLGVSSFGCSDAKV